jgi:hypothetical protein
MGGMPVCLTEATVRSYCTQGAGYFCTTDGGRWDPDAGFSCPESISLFCDQYAGPPTTNAAGDCCYRFVPSPPACGRPFWVDGDARRAPAVLRPDWVAAGADGDPSLDEATRRVVAHAWLEDARLEHSSIASFARFTIELLALGAPADLVVDAQRATADEVEHARLCFGLASRYAREPLGPGRLSIDGVELTSSLVECAASAVREGCVGETLAALQASEQLARATDPDVRAALARIAVDEARHAELAWRFVRWAIERGGTAVRAAVACAFRDALHDLERTVTRSMDTIDAAAYRAHGRLLPAEERACALLAARDIIEPCSGVLLGQAHDPVQDAVSHVHDQPVGEVRV